MNSVNSFPTTHNKKQKTNAILKPVGHHGNKDNLQGDLNVGLSVPEMAMKTAHKMT